MRKSRLYIIIFLVIVCSVFLSRKAFAKEDLDIAQNGSISINLKYKDEIVSNGNIKIYRVADIIFSNGNYSFEYCNEWKSCICPINEISSPDFPKRLIQFADNKQIRGLVKEIDQTGTVIFESLPIGLYLLTQEDLSEGFIPFNPFVISIPVKVEEEWHYHIDASPKIEVDKAEETEEPSYDEPDNESKLPQTGQLKWPIPVLAIAGLVIFAIGWLLYFEKREK